MAITRGQKAPTAGSTPGGTATQAVTFGTNPASGSAILVAITMWVNGTASVSSVTDNGSPANTYSLVTDGTTTAHAGPTGASDATWIYKADSIHLPGRWLWRHGVCGRADRSGYRQRSTGGESHRDRQPHDGRGHHGQRQ